MLERFYEPQSGMILLDGRPLNHYDIQYLREHLSVVRQQPILFEETVMENIRMGNRKATDQQIIDICQNLNVHQTIVHLSKVSSTDKYMKP